MVWLVMVLGIFLGFYWWYGVARRQKSYGRDTIEKLV